MFRSHELYENPVLLTKEEKENPYIVLDDFFTDYHLIDLRVILNDISETCLTADDPPFDTGENRANFLVFKSKLELVCEAIYVIVQQRGNLPRQASHLLPVKI